MGQRIRHPERRAACRPSNGQTMACPKCGKDTFEFNDRYRLPTANGIVKPAPAWVCDRPSCGYTRFSRVEDDPTLMLRELRMAAMKLRSDSRRRVMKARFVRQRAKRALAKSLARRKP